MSKVRTQLDKEKAFNKLQGEGGEYLDAITQEDEAKAADIIMEKGKEAEKATAEDQAKKIEELNLSIRFSRREYIFKMAQIGNEMAKHIDWPKDYVYRINFNEEKLNIMIFTPDGRRFAHGIKPCGDTDIDFHALGVLLTQAENTVDKLMERGAFNKAGIIIPN